MVDRFPNIAASAFVPEVTPFQVGVISLRIVSRFGSNDLRFTASEFRPQLIGDGFRHLALNRKNVGQFAIKAICPDMAIICCSD